MVNSSPSTPSKRSSRSLFPLFFNNNNNNNSNSLSNTSSSSNSSSQNENSPSSGQTTTTSTNNSNNSFDISKYAVQFTEVMEVEAARNHFYDYLTNIALCNETVKFMRDFEEYKNAYYLRFGNRLLPNNSSTLSNTSFSPVTSTPRNSTGSSLFGRRKTGGGNVPQTLDTKSAYSMNFVNDIFSGVVSSSSVAEPFVNAIKICFALASVIVDKYIVGGGIGLNLANTINSKVKNNWETLQNVYEANQWPEEAYHFITMVELLSPENLFGTVYLAVLTDMKLDQFPRYSRSDYLKNFLLKNGEEFTRAIALDITSRGRDCRFKSEDFIQKTLSDHHITNSFALIEDSPYWNCVYEKEKKPISSARYVSSTNFMIGKNVKGLKCVKYVNQLPYPRDYVLAVYASSKEVRKKLDPWILDFKNVAYYGCKSKSPQFTQSSTSSTTTPSSPRGNRTSLSNDSNGSQQESPNTSMCSQNSSESKFDCTVPVEEEPKAILRNSKSTPSLSSSPPTSPRSASKNQQLAFNTIDVPFTIGLGFSQRIFHFLCSLIYDAALDCFIMYHKTYEPNESNDGNVCEGKDPINAEGLTVHYFYKTSDNTTRLVTLIYADLHLPFQSDLYFKLITKSRGKELREGLLRNLPLFEKEWLTHCHAMDEKRHKEESPADNVDAFVDSLFKFNGTDDDFHFYKCLRENMKTYQNRSWYTEFLNSTSK